MKIISNTLLIVLSSLTMSCVNNQIKGNGTAISQERNIKNFDGITLAGSIDVDVTTGTNYTVVVEGDANLMDYIETEVKDGKLHIKQQNNTNLSTDNKIKVRVQLPELNYASVAGSGNIESNGPLNTGNQFKVSVAGSGDCKIYLNQTAAIDASIAGSGDIKIKGSAQKLTVDIVGSGNFDGYDLIANDAELKVVGSGDINAHVVNSLNATIMGSGDINYKGNASTTAKTMGSGKIHKKG